MFHFTASHGRARIGKAQYGKGLDGGPADPFPNGVYAYAPSGGVIIGGGAAVATNISGALARRYQPSGGIHVGGAAVTQGIGAGVVPPGGPGGHGPGGPGGGGNPTPDPQEANFACSITFGSTWNTTTGGDLKLTFHCSITFGCIWATGLGVVFAPCVTEGTISDESPIPSLAPLSDAPMAY